MKRLCAVVLILTLSASSMAAAGPLERSLVREAASLARSGRTSAAAISRPDWRQVRQLDRGSRIVITTADGSTISAGFVSFEDTAIVVDHGGALTRVQLDDVDMIERFVRRGSAAAAVLGTFGGIWLGSAMALAIGETSQCSGYCGGVNLAMGGLIFGVPIAAGYGAWRGTSHVTEEVIYRRAPALQP